MSEEGAHTTHQTDSRPWHGTPTTSILLPRPRSHTKIMTGGVAECGSAKMYVCVSERGAQSRLRHLLKTHRTPQLHLCLGGSGLRAPCHVAHAESGQVKPSLAKPSQAKPSQVSSSQVKSSQVSSSQVKSSQVKSSQVKSSRPDTAGLGVSALRRRQRHCRCCC